MNLFRVFAMIVLLAVSGVASSAVAASMSCLLGVYTAKDVAGDDASTLKPEIVTLPLDADGWGKQEFQVGGETVAMSVSKFTYTDLYTLDLDLKTPIADREPGKSRVAIATGYLYNDGPATGSWDIKRGPDAIRFAHLNQGGLVAISGKLKTALRAAGKDENNMNEVAEFVTERLKAKSMLESDVVAIAGLLSCTLEK